MYTCYVGAARLLRNNGSPLEQAFTVGLLHPIFLTCYELSGAHFGWWTWHPKEPAALQTKILGIPVMALYFHSVFGLCLTLWRRWATALSRRLSLKPNSLTDNIFQIIVAVIGVPSVALLFDIPTFVAEYFFGVSRIYTVAAFFVLSVVVVLRAVNGKNSERNNNTSRDSPWVSLLLPRVDAILFMVVVWLSTFMLLMDFNRVLAKATKYAHEDSIFGVVAMFGELVQGQHFICSVVTAVVFLSMGVFGYIFMKPLKVGKTN
jgi:hypothetical protein